MMNKVSNEIVSEDIKVIVDDLKDHYNVFENTIEIKKGLIQVLKGPGGGRRSKFSFLSF